MDKNKIIEAAAKLVAKGAYDKAIKEYQKVLEADPKDVRILQKMGELFQKKNDSVQAAQYFTKVAESYTTDGFFLKAVALYKQVLKLDGSLIDVNVKLAELHQQLQLLGEAMAYYQIVANHYDKAGDPKRSLEVLKKMVDLDPDNVPSRVKLADLYVREGMNEDALNEFQRAAEHLKRQNRIDDYLRVAERVSALDPGNLPLARELAELYLQRNDQKRALAKLQVCFKADNRDIDTLRLLAVAFQGLGQVSKTLSVYKELASAYQERGMMAEAEEVWAQVAQLDPNDPSVRAQAAQTEPPQQQYAPPYAGDEAEASDATMVQMDYQPPSGSALRTAGSGVTAVQSAYGASQSSVHGAATVSGRSGVAKADSTIAKFLTETDVYVKYGLHDKALEHLRKVFNVDPENIDAHEKAYAIYVSSNNHAQAFEQLLNVLRLHTRRGDAPRAQPYLATILQQNPNHAEVPVFLATLRMEGGVPVPDAAVEQGADDAILVDSAEDDVIVAEEPGEDVISAVAMSDEEPVEAADVVEDEADPYGQYAATGQNRYDLGDRLADPSDEAAAPEEAQVVSDFEEPPVPSGWVNEEEPPTGEHGLPPAEDTATQATTLPGSNAVSEARQGVGLGSDEDQEVPTRLTPRMDPALLKTSVGYRSPAAAPPGSFVPEEAPLEPAASEPSEPSESVESVESPEVPAPEPVEAAPQPVEEAVEAPPEEEPASEECDEASFFIEQGLYDEAREILETVMIAYPEHQRAAQLLAQLEALAAGGEAPAEAQGGGGNGEVSSSSAFDIAQELANELGDGGAGLVEAQPTGEDYQVSVEEVFAEFKKGLEKVVKPEDVDTHYDLGIAYKEMGLIDDAIGEFTVARRGCVQKKKEVDCLTMIGMLQVAKGDFAGAIDSYQQGLTSEHAAGDTEKALRYELAGAFEGAGQAGRALSQFLKVQALDPTYREVGQMVDRLSAVAVPEDDQPPQPPKARGGGARKVGYV